MLIKFHDIHDKFSVGRHSPLLMETSGHQKICTSLIDVQIKFPYNTPQDSSPTECNWSVV